MKKRSRVSIFGRRPAAAGGLRTAVVGLEAEFTLMVGGAAARPEKIFGTPADLLGGRGRMPAREGRSCQLPTGGALYFDSGVVEVATPLIEIAPAYEWRAVRSLWEQIAWLRRRLDARQARDGRRYGLAGFSSHYNVSFPPADPAGATLDAGARREMARLLCWILPWPVMLLATNRQSTAVGVRARERGRYEVTVDFTADPPLMRACLGVIVGILGRVTRLAQAGFPIEAEAFLDRLGLPRLPGFRPSRHASRRGWRAHARDFAQSPFQADPDAAVWACADGRVRSTRQMARRVVSVFRRDVRQACTPTTYEHLKAVIRGRARSLLDFDQPPPAHFDVAREPVRTHRARPVSRSRYERVIHKIIARTPILIRGRRYRVERMADWYQMVFRDVRTGRRRVFNLDDVLG